MKLLTPSILVLSLVLFGCNAAQKDESAAKETKKQEETSEKNNDGSNKEKSRAKSLSHIYVPNPQVSDDTKLLNVGQTIEDSKEPKGSKQGALGFIVEKSSPDVK